MYTQPVNQRFIDQEKNRQRKAGGGDGSFASNLSKPTSYFIPPMYNKPENARWFDQEREKLENQGLPYTGPSEAVLARCDKYTEEEMQQMELEA